MMIVSAVHLFLSFFANLHFQGCSALIVFILITLVLRYLCRVYLQNFTQHHSTTSSTTKKRVGTEFDFFLNYLIIFSNLFLSPTVVCFKCTKNHPNLFFLCEFIQGSKISKRTNDLSRRTVLAISPIFIQFISQFDQ